MSRLAQLGVFSVVLGGVVLFLGLFPAAVDADGVPGIGLLQIVAMLTGLFVLVMGAYVVTFAVIRQGHPPTLLNRVGIRLGLTGMVLAASATLADALGFGSHTGAAGPTFGWLQTMGVLVGFGLAALGVLIYGYTPTR